MTKRITVTFYDENLMKDFEEFVIETYGTKYSFYGRELEKALRYHMATMGFKNYPEKVGPVKHGKTREMDIAHAHKLKGNLQTLYEWLLEFKEDSRIEYTAICKFLLKKCKISDKRTYERYLEILVDLDILDEIYDGEAYRLREKEAHFI